MAEDSGSGHWFDSGSGPVSVDLLPEAAAAETAWQRWVDHRDGCAQCRTAAYRCPTGNQIWYARETA